MRRLDLHVSALNDAEFDLYTSSFADILADDDDKVTHDDAYYERITIGVREARAWLRGRYSHIPAATLESILRLFSPNLAQSDTLTGGQFFAALRLVVHAESGKEVDRALAFTQAHPGTGSPSRPLSPSKPPAPPKPVRSSTDGPRPARPPSRTKPSNPSQAMEEPVFAAPRSSLDQPPQHPVQRSAPGIPQPTPNSNNPFFSQTKSMSSARSTDSPARLPPLPPRKPPPPIPAQSSAVPPPPPRHSALLFPSTTPSMGTSRSAPPFNSQPSSSNVFSPVNHVAPKTASHVTSTLMKQSLQASKAAQTMKRAEEQLEKERVLQVLRRSSSTASPALGHAPRNRSNSPNKMMYSSPSSAYTSSTDDAAPPLPRRKSTLPSPPMSASSMEQIALAGASSERRTINYDASPFRSPVEPVPTKSIRSPSVSPSRASIDLPSGPPPKHPDRKPSLYSSPSTLPMHKRTPSFSQLQSTPGITSSEPGSFEAVYGTPSASASPYVTSFSQSPAGSGDSPTARIFRSKSMHQASPSRSPAPPTPPIRRKRPESFQVASGSPLFEYADPIDSPSQIPVAPRRVSMSNPRHRRESSTSSGGNASGGHNHESPFSNIQRTIATLQPKLDALQPKLDKARYKAEAGLSRRGFVHNRTNKGGIEGEEEEELMGARGEDKSEDDWDKASMNGGVFDDEFAVNGRNNDPATQRMRPDGKGVNNELWEADGDPWVGVEKDNLKWPAGEGWKQMR